MVSVRVNRARPARQPASPRQRLLYSLLIARQLCLPVHVAPLSNQGS